MGYAPRMRRLLRGVAGTLAVFAVGTAIVVLFGYRWYQNELQTYAKYCEGSYEVSQGGGKYSCIEPYNWFALNLGILFFVSLDVVVLVIACVAGWFFACRRDAPGTEVHVDVGS